MAPSDEAADARVAGASARRFELLGIRFDPTSTNELAHSIVEAIRSGSGGWLLTPNLSILRQLQDPELAWIADAATHVVPDGQPLQWLAKAAGEPIGPRVTGADVFRQVIESVPAGSRVLLVGGPASAVDSAAVALSDRGVRVVGASSPPLGFDVTDSLLRGFCARLASELSEPPELVALALPFPRQERLARELRSRFPAAYYLNTGAAMAFWTGTHRRAPQYLQSLGLEWAFRLVQEPRRLARRYLVEDTPFLVRTWLCSYGARVARQLRLRLRLRRPSSEGDRPALSYFNIHKGSFWRSRGDQPLLYRRRLKELERAIGGTGRLLDVGCGEGYFASRAEKRGWDVTAVDGLMEGVESTRSRVSSAVVRLGDAHRLDFPDDTFDAVVAWDLLEHLEDPQSALAEMRRVLRPAGVLGFSTPNTGARSVETRGRDSIQYKDATHISLDPPNLWLRRLEAVGLCCELAGTDAYWNPPYPGYAVPGLLYRVHAQAVFATRYASPDREDGENFVVLARKPA